MDTKNKKTLLVALALGVALVALGYLSFGKLGDNLVYYWTPGEALQKGEQAKNVTVRLGGIVAPGTVNWDAQALQLRFKVADDHKPGSPTLLVDSKGAPPQMFREGIGVVVEGRLGSDNIFHSDRVMVNHSNEYRPPKEGEAADKHYGSETVMGGEKAAAAK